MGGTKWQRGELVDFGLAQLTVVYAEIRKAHVVLRDRHLSVSALQIIGLSQQGAGSLLKVTTAEKGPKDRRKGVHQVKVNLVLCCRCVIDTEMV